MVVVDDGNDDVNNDNNEDDDNVMTFFGEVRPGPKVAELCPFLIFICIHIEKACV